MYHFWVYLLNLWIESVSDIFFNSSQIWLNTYLWLGRSKELLSLSSIFFIIWCHMIMRKKKHFSKCIPESKCIKNLSPELPRHVLFFFGGGGGLTANGCKPWWRWPTHGSGDLWDQPRELQSHHIILGRWSVARTLARCTLASRCHLDDGCFRKKMWTSTKATLNMYVYIMI